jgi:hypothetical protein
MATFAEIKRTRISLADPSGFINIVQVATTANLPATPGQQTLYNIINTGAYMATIKTSGATISDYKIKNLYLSDTVISEYITLHHTVEGSLPYLILLIISQLADKKLLKSTGTGAESKTYTGLLELITFYEKLYNKYNSINSNGAHNATQKTYRMHIPRVCGGDV